MHYKENETGRVSSLCFPNVFDLHVHYHEELKPGESCMDDTASAAYWAPSATWRQNEIEGHTGEDAMVTNA